MKKGFLNVNKRPVRIIDTTLRDGAQAPGVVFSTEERNAIAERLDRIGVHEIEAGIPAMGSAAREDIRALAALGLSCRLSAWCRAREDDIAMAARCRIGAVHISFPVSDILLSAFGKNRGWVRDHLSRLVLLARREFDHVSVGAQDATRTDPDFLDDFAAAALTSGADRLRLADTVGIARPKTIARLIRAVSAAAPGLPLEFHGHDDLGMATANTVTAIEAGADAASVTVNGLGERAGNAPLEEVVMGLAFIEELECGIRTQGLSELCALVADASGRSIPPDKAITGPAVFRHASGIHCAALLKDPLSYQPFLPRQAGRTGSEVLVGAQSGVSVIRSILRTENIPVDEAVLPDMVERIRERARIGRQPLDNKAVVEVYRAAASVRR